MPGGQQIQAQLDEHAQEDAQPIDFGVPGIKGGVLTAQASQTVRWNQSGTTFICAVDAVMTLPAITAASKGVWYRFVCGVASSGTGLSISPNSADNFYSFGITPSDGKDMINTGTTDVVGDFIEVMSDGTNWLVIAMDGTWARET